MNSTIWIRGVVAVLLFLFPPFASAAQDAAGPRIRWTR